MSNKAISLTDPEREGGSRNLILDIEVEPQLVIPHESPLSDLSNNG